MKIYKIRALLNKLSEENKEQVKGIIWFFENDCICDTDYIHNALELAELINNLKQKYE